MRALLVGGFVRDTLMGLNPHDRDYVVIDQSPESMRAQGYILSGEHFPVFRHPVTQEEYALARSEKSTGHGHGAFECAWEGVTLEEDLFRRDLTINAMAFAEDGTLIDPYGGKADLEAGVLRQVSRHFQEDPLRILRVARFAARYQFTVHPGTMALMRRMVKQDMLETLSPERLWQETQKAMLTDSPGTYFDVLDACGALERVFPELHCLKDIPQRPDYHAEGDTWVHTRMVLEQACAFSAELSDARKLRVRMAALLHDLGKANTPFEELWADNGELIGSHHGHEDLERFEPPLDALSERIKMPGDIRQFVAGVALVHQKVHGIFKAGGHGLVSLYQALDLSRKLRHDADILDDVALACAADNYGRLTLLKDGTKVAPTSYHQADYFKKAMLTIQAVDPGTVIKAVLAKGHGLKTAKEQLLARQRGSVKPMIAEHRALGEDAIAKMLGTRG